MIFWLWAGFITVILVLLFIDLGVINRRAHAPSAREALGWLSAFIALALLFNVGVYFIYEHRLFDIAARPGPAGPDGAPTMVYASGWQAAVEFFTGWLMEYSLSLDNIFVIAVIFQYFRVPPRYQHRVLFWGILGALVMRGAMIGAGVALIAHFSWVMYIFGALLLFTAIKMLRIQDTHVDPDRNMLVRIARRFYPVSSSIDSERFFVHVDGRRTMTPLFVALLVVESTDVLFAVDSIPAIFAITRDPFIVFTSNVFAILGLRSMYFALAVLMDRFRHIKISLAFILAYVGVKMLVSHHFKVVIPVGLSLGVIVGALLLGVLASWRAPRQADAHPPALDR
ncbi:MAG: TerC family protein [Phycisphaerae bacterium]